MLVIGVPVVLVVRQPDLGTGVVLFFFGMIPLFLAGLHRRFIYMGALAGFLAVPVLWVNLHQYQRQRILNILNPESDPLGAGYHAIQSKIAIGSGGGFGKGWMQSSQAQFGFLPEPTTDFVFSVISEEFGFAGAVVAIAPVHRNNGSHAADCAVRPGAVLARAGGHTGGGLLFQFPAQRRDDRRPAAGGRVAASAGESGWQRQCHISRGPGHPHGHPERSPLSGTLAACPAGFWTTAINSVNVFLALVVLSQAWRVDRSMSVTPEAAPRGPSGLVADPNQRLPDRWRVDRGLAPLHRNKANRFMLRVTEELLLLIMDAESGGIQYSLPAHQRTH